MKYQQKLTLISIPMPTHINYEREPGKRQDGFNLEEKGIPVEQFTKEEAEEYGEFLKQYFIKHWEQAVAMAKS